MDASVILPTRNRSQCLQRCLASLAEQTHPPDRFEVIVVDNGSEDNTEAVAKSFSRAFQLRYVYAPEPGLHVGRHEGMRTARSDVLVFADDDIEATPDWVNSIVTAFQGPEVAMVGGNNYPAFEQKPPDWLLRMWERPVYKGRALGYLSILDFGSGRFDINPNFIWGCNFSIRREILIQAGGFHPDGMPKEKLRYRGDGETHVSRFVRASGLRAVFDSGASVYHHVPGERMTEHYFEMRAFNQGVSDSYTYHRNRNLPKAIRYTVKRYGVMLRPDSGEPEQKAFRRRLKKAYWDGFDYHWREIRSDITLRDWVEKAIYF